jgi:hypothetical protein
MKAAETRVASVVAGVVEQALADSGASGLILLRGGSPEAALLVRWLSERLGAEAVQLAPSKAPELEDRETGGAGRDDLAADEGERHRARVLAATQRRLVAHPAHKTELLLGGAPPPEPILPLGDLYASDIARFAGAVTVAPDLGELAEQAGGLEALDKVLRLWIDGREATDRALQRLDAALGAELERRVAAGRFWRRRAGLVPKLGSRTIGIDLLS